MKISNHRQSSILDDFVPPMPQRVGEHNVYYSYFALHTSKFRQYTTFARMFLVALESTFRVRDDFDNCPLNFERAAPYTSSLCWCFVMERLVDIWARQSRIRRLKVDFVSGAITEVPEFEEAQGQRWKRYFSERNIDELSAVFKERLDKAALEVYDGFYDL